MSKKAHKEEPQQDVPPPVEEAAPLKGESTAIAKAAPRSEIMERVQECLESLETFSGAALPMIRFKEGFTMSEGEDDVEDFEGVIIYTKEMNAYYKDRYKAGEKRQPDCLAPDGKIPITANPVAANCGICPNNKFGSAKEGDGKACKNVRPVFVLVKNQETGEFGVIPRVLRVPPTSLMLVKSYVMALAADFGAYFAVTTKFRTFKRSEEQTHYNIGFTIGKRLSPQERADILFIRNGWLERLKGSTVGADEAEHDPVAAPTMATDVKAETRF